MENICLLPPRALVRTADVAGGFMLVLNLDVLLCDGGVSCNPVLRLTDY
jgi:hypothetical protein